MRPQETHENLNGRRRCCLPPAPCRQQAEARITQRGCEGAFLVRIDQHNNYALSAMLTGEVRGRPSNPTTACAPHSTRACVRVRVRVRVCVCVYAVYGGGGSATTQHQIPGTLPHTTPLVMPTPVDSTRLFARGARLAAGRCCTFSGEPVCRSLRRHAPFCYHHPPFYKASWGKMLKWRCGVPGLALLRAGGARRGEEGGPRRRPVKEQ